MEKQSNNLCGEHYKAAHLALGVFLAVLAVYVAVLAANAVKANKYIGKDTAVQSTISVSGSGDVFVKPNLVVMDFSVVSEGTGVSEATADNNKKMNAIVDAAKSLGITDKDMQTTAYNISPRYDYVKQVATPAGPSAAIGSLPSDPAYGSGRRVLSGYDVTQTLTIKIREENMLKIGQIIEEATAAGANQVGDLQFTLDSPEAVQAQAREKAISDAKSKAGALAAQLGVKLVRITGYSDGGYYPAAQLNFSAKEMAVGTDRAVAPNIQTGENKVTANVSITYEIE